MKSVLWKTLCGAYPSATAHFSLAPEPSGMRGPLPEPRRWALTVSITCLVFHLLRHASDCSKLACNPDLANETKEDVYQGFLGKIFPILKGYISEETPLPVHLCIQLCDDAMPEAVTVTWWLWGDKSKEESQQMKTAKQKNRKHLGAWCAPDLTNPKNISLLYLFCEIIIFNYCSSHI